MVDVGWLNDEPPHIESVPYHAYGAQGELVRA